MNRVAVVIPNWNGAAMLSKLLEDLGRQSCPPGEVIVVDNGSTDESAAMARGAGATVIELGSNTGFSHAVNRGIRAADAEWIGILNNDVRLEPDWLGRLLEKADASRAWFAAGKLLDASESRLVDGAFDAICRGACAWRCGNGRPDAPVWNEGREIRFTPLTAALVRAQLFERVGVLDEEFESYLEDIDFGIRCATAGFSGLYVPEAVAYHQGSATLGRWHPETVRRVARNQLLIIAKHYPPEWVIRYGWPIAVAQILWGFTALKHGALLAYLAGKVEGVRRFREARGTYQRSLDAVLDQSEAEIRELQQLTGYDLYWRLYFALT